MRIYRDLDLVEQLGSGMNRILKAYSKDVFRFSKNFLEVCFEYEGDSLESLEKNSEKSSEKILRLLKQDPQLTIADLATKLHISTRAIEQHLKNLQAGGSLQRIGSRKEGHWKVVE